MANGNACANSAATPQLGDPERYIPYSGVAHIVGLAYAAGVKIHPASAQAALLGMASNIAVVGKLLALSEPPSLNERDVAAIADLSRKVKLEGKRSGNGGEVNVSVGTFVPKPHTPFQWEPQINTPEIKEKQWFLRDELKRKKLNFKRGLMN